eukprot:comp15622_c0_seq1/m.12756 comp15622_c0_seq1/g.12756  ORF comp15622_c0_seq1/g.12756 comp15622_c0_seq1/m.12756 type:complete len:135 (-) comp15622_c0_seq1:980-1384(-)
MSRVWNKLKMDRRSLNSDDLERTPDASFPKDLTPQRRRHSEESIPVPSTIAEESSTEVLSASLPSQPSPALTDSYRLRRTYSLEDHKKQHNNHVPIWKCNVMATVVTVPESVPQFRETLHQLKKRSLVEEVIAE